MTLPDPRWWEAIPLPELTERERQVRELDGLVRLDERWHSWQDLLGLLAGFIAVVALVMTTEVALFRESSPVPDLVLIVACLAAVAFLGARWVLHRNSPMHQAYLTRCPRSRARHESLPSPDRPAAFPPRR